MFRRIPRLIQRKAWRFAALLREWSRPESNPFLQRELRVAQRKGQPFRSVASLSLGFLSVVGAGYWYWNWLFVQRGKSWLLLTFAGPHQLPSFLGGNIVGGVAIFTAFCCALGAVLSVGSRSTKLLRAELLQGTLDQLQLLPQREERWLWQMRAHGMAHSLLCFLCGLPVYSLAVFCGLWSPGDIFGLLLLFIFIGHGAPVWVPLQWHMQQGRAKRFDWKAWQEAMKLVRRENAEMGQSSVAAQLEAQRRIARVWESLEPAAATTQTKPEAAKSLTTLLSSGNRGTPQGNASKIWLWVIGMQFISPAFIFMFLKVGSPLNTVWTNFRDSLPPDVRALGWGFLVTWPLIIEKILRAPLPFFAFALPPLVIYLPFWLSRQVHGNLSLAANVSSCETFWTVRRVRLRQTAASISIVSFALIFFGFGWQSLVEDGVLAALMPGSPADASSALAVLWTILLLAAIYCGGAAHEKPFARAQAGEIPAAQAWRGALRIAPLAAAGAVAVYFFFCLLARRGGVDGFFLERLAPVLCTIAAFWLADFGSAALQTALPEERRAGIRLLRFLWFFGLVMVTIALLLNGMFRRQPFALDAAPFVLLSPFVSTLALLRFDLNTGWPWWLAPAFQSALGGVMMLRAALLIFEKKAAVEAQEDVVEAEAERRGFWAAVQKFLLSIWTGIANFFTSVAEIARRVDDTVIQSAKRTDNPILHEEVKRRVRREHWPWMWLLVPLLAALMCAQFRWAFGWWPPPEVFGVLAILWTFTVVNLTATPIGASFDRDRANGTLVFVFLTPLTEKEILIGKTRQALIHAAGLLLGIAPFLLAAGLGFVLAGKWEELLIGCILLLFVPAFLAFSTTANLVGALLVQKRGQAAGAGFAAGVFGQMLIVALPCLVFAMIDSYIVPLSLPDPWPGALLGIWLWTWDVTLAVFGWNLALGAMKKLRYSDAITSGKGAA